MEYENAFKVRAKTYTQAIKQYPNVLDNEYSTAAKMLDIIDDPDKPAVVINVPSDIDLVWKFIPNSPNITYIPFEISKQFIKEDEFKRVRLCNSLSEIPMPDESVDRVLCLASLHHSSHLERAHFYRECYRLLKPHGKLVIGDVIKGSFQDRWLNKFVDEHNSIGHKGLFFDESDAKLLEEAGYHVKIEQKKYDWEFENKRSMIDFCKLLFGLDLADDETILCGLDGFLPMTVVDTKHPTESRVCVHWKLIYFVCTKITPDLDPQFAKMVL